MIHGYISSSYYSFIDGYFIENLWTKNHIPDEQIRIVSLFYVLGSVLLVTMINAIIYRYYARYATFSNNKT